MKGAPIELSHCSLRHRAPLTLPAIYAATTLGPNGKVYVFGGETGKVTHTLDATRIYDLDSDTWTLGAPMPVQVTEPSSALAMNAKIYVMGGGLQVAGRQVTDANNEYDPVSNSWRSRAPMPIGRTAFAIVAARNHKGHTLLYAIGGRNYKDDRNGLSSVEAYDPDTNSWEEMAPMPTYRHALSAALGADGNIYVIGGAYRDSEPHFTAAVEVYDPRLNKWAKAPDAPCAVECAGVAATTGRNWMVYYCGGWYSPDKKDEASVFAYNPRSRSWKRLLDLPVATAAAGLVDLSRPRGRQSLLIIGGTPNGTSCTEYFLPE